MRVRNITISDDVNKISELYRMSYEETYGVKLEGSFELGDHRDFFLLFDEDEIIGFASINVNEITHLYLKPGYFDQGLGNLLLREMVKEIRERGYDFIYLWDVLDNQRALSFYEKNGFVRTTETRMGEHHLQEVKYILEV